LRIPAGHATGFIPPANDYFLPYPAESGRAGNKMENQREIRIRATLIPRAKTPPLATPTRK